jgi:YidC/Oxa1 family membrane protein insertase
MALPSQESHISKERQTATIYFRSKVDQEVDYINPNSNEEKSITDSEINWVVFKQQFFSCALISEDGFTKGTKLITQSDNTSLDYVKRTSALLGFPYNKAANDQHNFKFYFGPNHYYTLKDQKLGLEEVIPIGWSIFSVINKWIVIPVFNSFKNTSISYGWVILILTVITKMRLLKPEIDVINAKFTNDPMKKNQETMGLYSKAGASPLSGCIPALIQLPILIALFNFFPASIELRQEEFLWAGDLSTYDSIWTFGYVPVIDWVYGDHVSLFALLMFLSTIAYTWMNQKMMPMNNQQMPGMQTMMYLMPLIFLSFMNSYSAGLSWYYFLANMITFGQTFLMRKMVSDDKLRAKLEDNMKKPRKLSGFQARLEEMAKKQQQRARK